MAVMLAEFFCHHTVSQKAWAWSGCVAIVTHALIRAYIKYLMNDWMGRFYDLGGSAQEVGSGETELLEQGAERVTQLLLEFGVLCLPNVLVHPLFKLLTNRWILSWRVELVNAYLLRWGVVQGRIENGAQRIHEDTQRFARGLQTCVITVLDSVLTLAVFSPVLVELGSKLQPVKLPSSWLMLLCTLVAAAGLLVSLVLGWSLVALEVENQRVEADLRKQLVLYEHSKERREIQEFEQPVEVDQCERDGRGDNRGSGGLAKPPEPRQSTNLVRAFSVVMDSLVHNYKRLYNRFAVFSLWLGAYEQFVVLLPYMIAGPLLFSQRNRITLGKVTQVSHAFGNVFDALNILSDRWIEVTDWLSVMRRLREFEAMLYGRRSARWCLIQNLELSTSSMTQHPEQC